MGIDPSPLHFLSYNICPQKIVECQIFLVWTGNSVSFSFGFCWFLSNRKMTEVISLLSWIEVSTLGLGERSFMSGVFPPRRAYFVSLF